MATIEDLEKRIIELEKKANKLNTLLFGRSYGEVGSLDSDLILKSRGLVKLQVGSKFLDLIKDGKLNSETSFIYKQDKIGVKDGIYVIDSETGLQVILLVNGQEVNLGGSSTEYVSFLKPLNITPEQKYLALLNIGLIVDSIESVPLGFKGIVYIESESRIYTSDGFSVIPLTSSLPESVTLNITFSKGLETSEDGIKIKDIIINNKNNRPVINSNSKLYLSYNNNIVGSLDKDLHLNGRLFVNSIIGDNFTIGIRNGKSYIDVDSVSVNIDPSEKFYLGKEYIITSKYKKDSKDSDISEESSYKYIINTVEGLTSGNTLYYKNKDLYEQVHILSLESTENYNIELDDNLPESAKLILPNIIISKDELSTFIVDDNNPSSVPNISWVNSKILAISETITLNIPKDLPENVILGFHGETIPEGWTLCNGENGTPNLIGSFIKETVDEENTSEEIKYSLVYIMKIK